jgi:hypothetical protein
MRERLPGHSSGLDRPLLEEYDFDRTLATHPIVTIYHSLDVLFSVTVDVM